jgi:light-regulated signal transduction histidine kinase (bacteriophytochrome)
MTSHRVRQPVSNILGIAHLLDVSGEMPQVELTKLSGFMKTSALLLDKYTDDLTHFTKELKSKKK